MAKKDVFTVNKIVNETMEILTDECLCDYATGVIGRNNKNEKISAVEITTELQAIGFNLAGKLNSLTDGKHSEELLSTVDAAFQLEMTQLSTLTESSHLGKEYFEATGVRTGVLSGVLLGTHFHNIMSNKKL